jgi:hypothetical protein
MAKVALWTMSRIPLWRSTISNEVTNMTTIVAGVGDYALFL